jgi:hypothetical protein
MTERGEYMARQEADHDLIRQRHLVTSCGTDYEYWLRMLATKGGKGVCNNIDARSLGRAADQLAHYVKIIGQLRDDLAALEEHGDI